MPKYNLSEDCPKCNDLVSVELLRDWIDKGEYHAEFRCENGHTFTKSVSIRTGRDRD